MDSSKKPSLPQKGPESAASRLRRMTSMSISTGSSGTLKTARLQARFGHDSGDEALNPLVTHLDKYSDDELKEYRQVFNMFDAGEFDLFFNVKTGRQYHNCLIKV